MPPSAPAPSAPPSAPLLSPPFSESAAARRLTPSLASFGSRTSPGAKSLTLESIPETARMGSVGWGATQLTIEPSARACEHPPRNE